jgi:hypothetical protein
VTLTSPLRTPLQTLQAMGRLIVDGARDPSVRAAYAEITRQLPERDIPGALEAVTAWVRENLRYQWDPWDAEVLTSAPRLLRDVAAGYAYGDCDDWVILVAALLRSGGIPVLVKGIQGKAESRELDHVYLLAGDPRTDVWTAIDPINRSQPVGWEPPSFLRWLILDPATQRVLAQGKGSALGVGKPVAPRRASFHRPVGNEIPGAYAMMSGLGDYGLGAVDCATDPAVRQGVEAFTGKAYGMDRATAERLACATRAEDAAVRSGAQVEIRSWMERGRGVEQARQAAAMAAVVKLAGTRLTARALATDRELAAAQDECDAMIAEVVRVLEALPPTVAPLMDVIAQATQRLQDRAAKNKLVNDYAKIAADVLSALASVTAGITEVLALAVTAANVGYQLRQMGHMLAGSQAKTLREAGGAAMGVGNVMDWADNLITRATQTWYALEGSRLMLADAEAGRPTAPRPSAPPAARGLALPLAALAALVLGAR